MNKLGCVWWLCVVTVLTLSTPRVGAVTPWERQRHVIRQGEVTEVISNSVTSGASGKVSQGGEGRRKRAENSLSSADVQESLDKHNNLRKDEGAADMMFMVWDDDLATLAQDWAELCDFVHDQPGSHPTYDSLGQNLYLTTGSSVNIGNAIQAWFDEKSFFTYNTNTCDGGKVCGHYTQVVWAESFLLGCGVSQCAPLTDSDAGTQWDSGTYFVCNYAPAGNDGSSPFTTGTACTKCGTGEFNCNPDGLCVDDCSTESCECKACDACQNCATIEDDCTCTCQDGYTGVDCSENCEDTDARCNANLGWPPVWCTEEYPYVLAGCPLMCDLCTEGTGGPQEECDNGCPADSGDGDTTEGSSGVGLLQATHILLLISLLCVAMY